MTPAARVLYLSYDGLTDPLGQSQILPYLKGLAVTHEIAVVSFEKVRRFAEEQGKITKVCHDHKIMWHPLTYHKSPPILSTLYDIWALKRISKILRKKFPFQVVHCRSYITSMVGLWLKRRYGVKFIFDMRGFWANERVEGGLWNLKNPIYKIVYQYFKKKEIAFCNQADRIIALTENAKEVLSGWGMKDKVTMIPCCVDLDSFDPEKIENRQKERLRTQLSIRENEFVLLYLGSWGTWYLTDEMLDFFLHVKSMVKDARFLIVTPDAPDLTRYKFKDDVVVRKASREEVPLFISLANAGICFIMPTFSKKASSATKVAEMLAMGVPVVSNGGWGDVSLHAMSLQGFCCVQGKDAYTSVVEFLLGPQDKAGIRYTASKAFSLDHGLELYQTVYDSVV